MKSPSLLALLAFLPALGLAQSTPPQPTVIESDGPGEMISTERETTITFRDNVRGLPSALQRQLHWTSSPTTTQSVA